MLPWLNYHASDGTAVTYIDPKWLTHYELTNRFMDVGDSQLHFSPARTPRLNGLFDTRRGKRLHYIVSHHRQPSPRRYQRNSYAFMRVMDTLNVQIEKRRDEYGRLRTSSIGLSPEMLLSFMEVPREPGNADGVYHGLGVTDTASHMADLALRCLANNAAINGTNTVSNAITSVNVVTPGAGIPNDAIAYRQTNLLQALQERSDASYHAWARGVPGATPCEFRLVRTGNATWELQIGRFSVDRRVGHSTNPVIFDQQRNNVTSAVMRNDHSKAVTVAYGNGKTEADFIPAIDALRLQYSPFNAVERSFSARDTDTVLENETRAQAIFRDSGDSTTLESKVRETTGARFGIDFNIGDWMSTRFDGDGYESVQLRSGQFIYPNKGAPVFIPSFEYLDGRSSRGRDAFEQVITRLNDIGCSIAGIATNY